MRVSVREMDGVSEMVWIDDGCGEEGGEKG